MILDLTHWECEAIKICLQNNYWLYNSQLLGLNKPFINLTRMLECIEMCLIIKNT